MLFFAPGNTSSMSCLASAYTFCVTSTVVHAYAKFFSTVFNALFLLVIFSKAHNRKQDEAGNNKLFHNTLLGIKRLIDTETIPSKFMEAS